MIGFVFEVEMVVDGEMEINCFFVYCEGLNKVFNCLVGVVGKQKLKLIMY